MTDQAKVDALGETLSGEGASSASGAGATSASLPTPGAGGPASPARIAKGTFIDRYVVIELLGAGGMGQVFAAFDPELDRKVAIKLLRSGRGSSSREHQSRLLREGKAMARLSHPNVVVVHDVGTFEGDLFVAMELIEGTTLEKWLAVATRPWMQVLGTFLQAGRGLEAAHAAGIVHRDFKPANVLVRTDGRVLVTDFGLARTASHHVEDVRGDEVTPPAGVPHGATQAGALLGTPAYMSPEQLAGKPAEARSDQFSFCLALYEGVYGQRPFDLPTISQTGEPDPMALDEARWLVPEPPRDSTVPAWLRRALLRGLAVDPRDRFATMSDLLAELGRDRGRVRRIAFAAGAVVILAGAGATFALTRDHAPVCQVPAASAIDAAWNPALKSAMQQAFIATKRNFAGDSFARVAGELDRRAADWRTAWIGACEATNVRHEQSAALLDLRMQCLDHRARELGALVDLLAHGKEPELVDKAVHAVAALPDTRECADAEQLSARTPLPSDAGLRDKIAQVRARLDTEVAEFRAGKAKALAATAPGLADEAAALSYPPLEAEARFWASEVFDELGDGKAAEEQLRKGLPAAAAGKDDIMMSRLLNALVYALGHHQKRYADADALIPAAEAVVARLDDDARRADLLFFRGIIAEDRGHYAESRPLLEQALAIRTKLLGPDHPEVAAAHQNLGIVLDLLGEYELSRKEFEQTYAILVKAYGESHPSVGTGHLVIGGALRRQGKLAEAKPHFEAALRIWEAAYGPDHPYVGMGLNNLLILLDELGERDEALKVGLRALEFKEKHSGPDTETTANTVANLGRLLRGMKRYAEARTYLERALAIRRKVLEPTNPDIATSLQGLALLDLDEGHPDKALPLATEALAIREKLGPDHPDLMSELIVLAKIQIAQHHAAAALPYLERALAIAAKKEADVDYVAEAKLAMARVLWDTNRDRAKAVALAQEALAAWKQGGAEAKEGSADAQQWLDAHKLPR